MTSLTRQSSCLCRVRMEGEGQGEAGEQKQDGEVQVRGEATAVPTTGAAQHPGSERQLFVGCLGSRHRPHGLPRTKEGSMCKQRLGQVLGCHAREAQTEPRFPLDLAPVLDGEIRAPFNPASARWGAQGAEVSQSQGFSQHLGSPDTWNHEDAYPCVLLQGLSHLVEGKVLTSAPLPAAATTLQVGYSTLASRLQQKSTCPFRRKWLGDKGRGSSTNWYWY